MKKVAFYTLGCKVNQYETEAMLEMFEKDGYEQVGSEDYADVYVINTCTVTHMSDRKSRQYIRRMKKKNPDAIIAVVGCYSQVSPEEILEIDEVNLVMGTNERRDIVKEIKNSDSKFKHDNLTKNKCPNCGKFMLEVKGKKGKMLVCEDRECNTRKTVSQITNSRCPNCHKKLELRGEGENKIFACQCGYREKLSAFNKRKAEEKQKGSKKDIQKYLKNQNKNEQNFNNPFAEALAKLKK